MVADVVVVLLILFFLFLSLFLVMALTWTLQLVVGRYSVLLLLKERMSPLPKEPTKLMHASFYPSHLVKAAAAAAAAA